jgi:hypothetical protein
MAEYLTQDFGGISKTFVNGDVIAGLLTGIDKCTITGTVTVKPYTGSLYGSVEIRAKSIYVVGTLSASGCGAGGGAGGPGGSGGGRNSFGVKGLGTTGYHGGAGCSDATVGTAGDNSSGGAGADGGAGGGNYPGAGGAKGANSSDPGSAGTKGGYRASAAPDLRLILPEAAAARVALVVAEGE